MSRRSYFQTLPRDVVKLGIPYLPIGRLIILWLNGDIDRSVIEENVQIFLQESNGLVCRNPFRLDMAAIFQNI